MISIKPSDVPVLHHAIEAISPPGVLGTVVGMLADLVVGVIVGAVVLGVVKLIASFLDTPAQRLSRSRG